MTYTIISAVYSNSDNTAAIMETVECYSVATEISDTVQWAEMLNEVTPEPYPFGAEKSKGKN